MKQVSMTDYEAATESYTGWCVTCQEFTRGCTEPDAENYDCPICGENTVMGAQQALIAGEIEPVCHEN